MPMEKCSPKMASPFCVLPARDVKVLLLSMVIMNDMSSITEFSIIFVKSVTNTDLGVLADCDLIC